MNEAVALLDAIERRGAADDAEVSTLLFLLGEAQKQVQRRAAHILAALPDRREQVVAMLASADARQRWGATYALSLYAIPPIEAVESLIECLGSPDGDVRWAAREILLGIEDAVDLRARLLAIASSGTSAQRKMAVYALRDLKACTVETEAAIGVLLADADAAVRIAAMSSLAKITIDRVAAANAIARLVRDDDAGVRRAAAATLGLLGCATEAVRRELKQAEQDPDPSLQRAARRSLEMLSG